MKEMKPMRPTAVASLWSIVRKEVKRIDAEHEFRQKQQQVIDKAEHYKALMRTDPRIIASVLRYVDRVDASLYAQVRYAPMLRTDVAETARVVLIGWNQPKRLAQWATESNIFWQNTAAAMNFPKPN